MTTAPDLNIPTVTQEHIDAFHRKHFSPEAIDSFFSRFSHPPSQHVVDNQDHDEHEEGGGSDDEDGLGYYPDGVKRTLTDEQIAIFRHSEEEAIRRAERKKLEEAKKRLEDRLMDGGFEDTSAREYNSEEMIAGEKEEEKVTAVKEAKSIGRVDKASGKTFMWPAIASTTSMATKRE